MFEILDVIERQHSDQERGWLREEGTTGHLQRSDVPETKQEAEAQPEDDGNNRLIDVRAGPFLQSLFSPLLNLSFWQWVILAQMALHALSLYVVYRVAVARI